MMRVAVTGAGGRLGSALAAVLVAEGVEVLGWSRPAFDLDRPATFPRLLERDCPDLVLHAAAWTDVDACARDPALAESRNGRATALLARACRSAGANFAYVSTNEVFDGSRTDGQGYGENDPTGPVNAYGRSKLHGETAVRDAYDLGDLSRPRAWVVRTAWLYGPPGADFGTKMLATARRARAAGEALRLVADEVGSPTRAEDLAAAIVQLLALAGGQASRADPPLQGPQAAPPGVYHLVNAGAVSRAAWAEELMAALGLRVPVEHVTARMWPRASLAPLWSVLDARRAAGHGVTMRPWRDALEDELPRYRALLEEMA
jgi:dTDP-4-dehydrorhamnose reductase